jgi:hypothetical protein
VSPVAEIVFALICAAVFMLGFWSGRRTERRKWALVVACNHRNAMRDIAAAKITDDPIWTDACMYTLKIIPNGLESDDPTIGTRYMEVRNAYIAGAQGNDFGVPKERLIISGTRS